MIQIENEYGYIADDNAYKQTFNSKPPYSTEKTLGLNSKSSRSLLHRR